MQATGELVHVWVLVKLGRPLILWHMTPCSLVVQKKIIQSTRKSLLLLFGHWRSGALTSLVPSLLCTLTTACLKISTPNAISLINNYIGRSSHLSMKWKLSTSMGRTIVSLTCSLACPITAFQMNIQIPLRPTSIGNSLLVWFSPSSQTVLFSLQSNLVTTKMSSANVYPKILFLVHNSLTGYGTSVTDSLSLRLVIGHFGADKSYASLWDAYYWPNMWLDLEKAYVPLCTDCQCNKSWTTKAPGLLHPLPIPDECGDSVALDFIGPLPKDQGSNCILTMTDCLGSDIHIIPTCTDALAEDVALLVFDNWYCNNGLPLNFVSDRDKLFVSCFWKALNKLTGVKLKMSSVYHPQTDGASGQTNKTVNQSIWFHIGQNQKGWVRALPWIHFCIMNTINTSTGYSGFQLQLGRSPQLIPPIVPTSLPPDLHSAASAAENIISQVTEDIADAKDNLLEAKLYQASSTNASWGSEITYNVGDKVMLSTFHRRWEYKQKGDGHAAKLFPRWDGPYTITKSHPESSSYTLDNNNAYPYYTSELKPYHENDATLFPNCKLPKSGPVLTAERMKEHIIEHILDTRKCSCGYQYLVRWISFRPEDNKWLPCKDLEDCKALKRWIEDNGDWPAAL